MSLFSITISSVSAPVSSSRKGLVEGGGTSGFFCWKRGSSLDNSQFFALWHTAASIFCFPEPFEALPSNLPSPNRGDQILAPSPSLPSTLHSSAPALLAPTLPESSLKGHSDQCHISTLPNPTPKCVVSAGINHNSSSKTMPCNKPQIAAPTACPPSALTSSYL